MPVGMLWAALAATIASVVVGFLWYGPIFGKPWTRAMGWQNLSKEDLKAKQRNAGPGYAASILTAAAAAVVIWYLFDWSWDPTGDLSKPAFGALLGATGWAAFYFPGTLTSRFFESRAWGLWGISAGFHLVQGILTGILVGVFY